MATCVRGAAGRRPCAPPGLEASLEPAKVPIGATLRQHAALTPPAKHFSTPAPAASPVAGPCGTQGEWVSAVMAVAPHLGHAGLTEALGLLDHAILNTQEAKALDDLIASLRTTACLGDPQAMHQLVAAEAMRLQVLEQQQGLLTRLHSLRMEAGAQADSKGQPGRGMQPSDLDLAQTRAREVTTDRVLAALTSPTAAQAAKVPPLAPAPRATTAAPEAQKFPSERQSRGARQVQTLSTSLQVLANEDPDCLFIVRRINKLGFKACRKLKQHFSQFGAVVRVLVAHSTVRQHGDPQCNTRRRPSSLGFVHMQSAEATRQVLALGAEHEVEGAVIRVQRFERQSTEGLEEEEDCADAPLNEKGAPWDRQASTFSAASTRTSLSTMGSTESETSNDAAGRE